MVGFKSDNQRKAVMARLNQNQPRAETRPSVIGRIRRRFRPIEEESREERGRRISREAQQLRAERLRVQQLEAEAGVEGEREKLALREREARARLREVDVERRRRRFAPITTGIQRVRERVRSGVERAQKVTRPRRRGRPRSPREEEGFFQI